MSRNHLAALVFTLFLLVIGCGGGDLSGDSQAAPSGSGTGAGSANLNLRIELRPGVNAQSLGGTPFRTVRGRLLLQGRVVSQAETSVESSATVATLVFVNIIPNNYTVEVDGLDQNQIVIAQDRVTVGTGAGSVNSALLVLQPGVFPTEGTGTTGGTTGGTGGTGTAPTAVNDTYTMFLNTTLTIDAATGVLANDTSADGTVSVLSLPAQGTLNLNPDGSFTYTPVAAASGSDQFTYQLTDAGGTATATVTINFVGTVFFVKANALGTGASVADPTGDLGAVLAAATSGDTVFILDDPSPLALSPFNFNVADGVKVVGEASGLTINGQQIVPPGNRPIVNVTLNLGNNVTVSGIRVQTQGMVLDNSQDILLEDVEINRAGQLVSVNEVGGTIEFRNCAFAGGGGGIISLSGTNNRPANLVFNGCNLGDLLVSLTAQGAQVNVTVASCQITSTWTFTWVNGASGTWDLRNNTLDSHALRCFHNNAGAITLNHINNDATTRSDLSLTHQMVTGAGTTVTIRDGDWAGSFDISMDLRTGNNDVYIANNNITGTGALLTNQQIVIASRTNATTQALIENNRIERGLHLLADAGGSMELGVLNNLIGVDPAPAGPLRRRLTIETTAASNLCGRVNGNSGLPTQSSINVIDAATLSLEELATVPTTNTDFSSIMIDPSTIDVPAGTCNLPTPR